MLRGCLEVPWAVILNRTPLLHGSNTHHLFTSDICIGEQDHTMLSARASPGGSIYTGFTYRQLTNHQTHLQAIGYSQLS